MVKLLKYLKPYTPFIVLAVVMLFVQANADLALPDYMSRIVNYGIQQGGVESPVPEAIRAQQMNRLLLFLTPEEQDLVRQAYVLIDQKSPDYRTYREKYPVLAQEPVYVLKAADRATRERLNVPMSRALVVISGVEQMMADPSRAARFGQVLGLDLSRLPPGADLFALLASLPADQRDRIVAAVNERFAALGEQMVEQMAVRAVRAEYDALGMDTARLQTAYILRVGGLMLLVTLIFVVATVTVSYLASRTAAGVARDLRRDVFAKVVDFSAAEFNRFSTASLITRTTNDVNQVQMVIFLIMRMALFAPIIGIGGILRALGKAPSMWWIIALAVAILVGTIMTLFSFSLPRFKIMQQLMDHLNRVVRENLSGIMVVRAFNKQKYEERRFDRVNRDLTDTMLFLGRMMVTLMPVQMLVMNGLSILIIWVGAHQVAQATIRVGDMIAFLQYAIQIVFSFMMLSFMFIFLPRSFVSGDRIAEVLETEVTIRDPERPKSFPEPFHGVVEFHDVCFRYPGAEEYVLKDITFTARPGQVTAIIGSTGSGKSTLLNLIPRFYDVTEGAILVDGVDIREVAQRDLRARIGYIPQRGILFSGTIESNLRYGDGNAPEEVLREAVEIAQAADFVFSPDGNGLDAPVAQGGANFSGGQKQRLAIARALVRRAPIYLFDDSFSALDYRTDAALRRALREKASGSTVIIVTQRVATIRNADQIIVLDEGRIVGKGTHQELMATCPTYREIALSQLREEEL